MVGFMLLQPKYLDILNNILLLSTSKSNFGSMVESLGDYAATCAVSGETYRVQHINKGIFA